MKSFIVAALASAAYAQTCAEWKADVLKTYVCNADFTECKYEKNEKNASSYEALKSIYESDAVEYQVGGLWYKMGPCTSAEENIVEIVTNHSGFVMQGEVQDTYVAPVTCEQWKENALLTFDCNEAWTECNYTAGGMFAEFYQGMAKDMEIGGFYYDWSPCGTAQQDIIDAFAGLDGLTVTQTALRKGLAKKLIKRRQEQDETVASTDEPDAPDIDRLLSGECWYAERLGEFVCESDNTVGSKIRDALDSVWDRYADQEAVDAWLETTQATAEEMSQRHQAEQHDFGEQIAADVKDAMEGVLHQMVNDLNEKMEQALNDFEAQEDETLADFDELVLDVPTLEMKRLTSLAKKSQEAEANNQYYSGFAAGALISGAASAIALYYIKKQQKAASEDAFLRV